ncbi:hypothetical protein [Agromyces silvae]|uniref:hypothetical protein n=1 Tax=Agromyces silvae TaxID=3388266 RepID=UPI00280BA4B7|nr:hypothetical protein [Agromyces protaetiae]
MSDINTPHGREGDLEGDEKTPADEMSSYDIAPPADEDAPAVPDEDGTADE